MKIFLLVLVALILGPACQTSKKKSKTNYASKPLESIYGAPVSRLAFLNSKVETSWSDINVCIEKFAELEQKNLLLEVKMAVLFWLSATDITTAAQTFSQFAFEEKANCDDKDPAVSYVIRQTPLGGPSVFAPANLQCQKTQESEFETQTSCSYSGITARASSGLLQTRFLAANPEQWVGIDGKDAGVIIFNGAVIWRSLAAELKMHQGPDGPAEIDAAAKLYDFLLNPVEQNFGNLMSLVSLMQKIKLISRGDTAFAPALAQLSPGMVVAVVKEYSYRPQLPIFHTMLHEWGHIFGLAHPDQLAPGIMLGQLSSEGQSEIHYDLRGLTKQAVMAYGESYLYLTADDVAGAQATASGLDAKVQLRIGAAQPGL